jgi:hypothetical protein
MITIMSYDRWMKYTYGGLTSVRSSQLKTIDAAVKRYNETKRTADLDALRFAIDAWMRKEGPGWKSSVRNKYHAVDDLDKQSRGLPTPARSGEEVYAFSLVRAESRTIVDQLFKGKSLDWKPGFFAKLASDWWAGKNVDTDPKILAKLGNNRVGTVGNAYTAASNSLVLDHKSSATKMAADLFKSIVPSHASGEVSIALTHVMPNFMTELATSLIPFAGVAVTGGVAVYNGIKTAFSQYDLNQARMHQARSLCVDEPGAAVNALIRILQRDRNYNAFSASVSGTAFAGKLAGILADGGTATNAAIGLAAGAAKLMNIIRVITRDVLEKREANRRMQMGGLNGEIFDVCPIVGCYLILCVPTSVMVNTVFDRISEHGWRGDVERTVTKHLVPLQNEARTLIQNGRFEITAMNNFPGMLVVNKNKLAQMQAWKEWRDRHPDRRMDARGPNGPA